MRCIDVVNYHSRLKQRLEWEEYIIEHGFTHYVTFNFNFHDTVSIEAAKRKLIKFGMMINRKLHGQRFAKKPHTSFIAFPEHLDSNFHFHVALTTPDIEGFR